ncbi:hypothetical protein E2C01_055860 [Portunus trituberculatus]|uniref:Uncharacterized protein n=1 Tax=Portunus trituberculatus TaxID=210409 RepID=A0A5B7GYT5_PORTR|nr:hypothetical protein [Portunus trituberculatus]
MPSTSSSSLESNITHSVFSPAVVGFTVNWHRASPPTGTVLGRKEMVVLLLGEERNGCTIVGGGKECLH